MDDGFIELKRPSGSIQVRASAVIAIEPDPERSGPEQVASWVYLTGHSDPLTVDESVDDVRYHVEIQLGIR